MAGERHLGIEVEYTNSIGMKFRLIPPGEFTMGGTATEIDDALRFVTAHWQDYIRSETPHHRVILTQPFYFGTSEVTQAEYEKVMGQNPSHFSAMGGGIDAVVGVESFAFLGYSFRRDKIYPRRESLAKMKTRIKERASRKRTGSIQLIAADLNRVLVGWFGYFRHCRWTIYQDLAARIRARLRRLLLKRHRKNPERLPHAQRWPNAYFAKAGLDSLREAHFRFAQSVNY